jgi:hypothetical protein
VWNASDNLGGHVGEDVGKLEMLPSLLQMEARLKLQGSSERGESQATAYAAKGLSSKKDLQEGKLGKLGELERGLGKLGELLPVWESSQVDGVQGLQGDRVPKLWKDRAHVLSIRTQGWPSGIRKRPYTQQNVEVVGSISTVDDW